MVKVRIKEGCSHRVPAPEWNGDPDRVNRVGIGPLVYAGEEIEVTEAELESFGDKFELVEPAPVRKRSPRKPKPAAEEQ